MLCKAAFIYLTLLSYEMFVLRGVIEKMSCVSG